MKIGIHNQTNTLEVREEVFGVDYNEALIHQVVTAYLSAGRAGTKSQKTRAEVRGGGRKPWKQKGSGRARAGTIRSPIWRGGGIIFAAKPRSFAQKVNRKMYRGALVSILSELNRQERLIVVEDLTINTPKTKGLVSTLSNLKVTDALILTHQDNHNLVLAARNLRQVEVLPVTDIDPVALIARENVVVTVEALKQLEARFT